MAVNGSIAIIGGRHTSKITVTANSFKQPDDEQSADQEVVRLQDFEARFAAAALSIWLWLLHWILCGGHGLTHKFTSDAELVLYLRNAMPKATPRILTRKLNSNLTSNGSGNSLNKRMNRPWQMSASLMRAPATWWCQMFERESVPAGSKLRRFLYAPKHQICGAG